VLLNTGLRGLSRDRKRQGKLQAKGKNKWRGDANGGPGARAWLNVDAWRREAVRGREEGSLDLNDGDVRSAFGVMLAEWDWDTFCTWTFREMCGPIKAEREVREWLRWVAYGQGEPVGWVYGTEQEPGADRPHAHGLLVGTKGVLWEPLWRSWFIRNGAMRTEVPRSGEAVGFYCTKYIAKRGAVYFSGNLEAFRAGRTARIVRAAAERVGEQLQLGGGALADGARGGDGGGAGARPAAAAALAGGG